MIRMEYIDISDEPKIDENEQNFDWHDIVSGDTPSETPTTEREDVIIGDDGTDSPILSKSKSAAKVANNEDAGEISVLDMPNEENGGDAPKPQYLAAKISAAVTLCASAAAVIIGYALMASSDNNYAGIYLFIGIGVAIVTIIVGTIVSLIMAASWRKRNKNTNERRIPSVLKVLIIILCIVVGGVIFQIVNFCIAVSRVNIYIPEILR